MQHSRETVAWRCPRRPRASHWPKTVPRGRTRMGAETRTDGESRSGCVRQSSVARGVGLSWTWLGLLSEFSVYAKLTSSGPRPVAGPTSHTLSRRDDSKLQCKCALLYWRICCTGDQAHPSTIAFHAGYALKTRISKVPACAYAAMIPYCYRNYVITLPKQVCSLAAHFYCSTLVSSCQCKSASGTTMTPASNSPHYTSTL